jgi:hypothetical protein
MNNNKKFGDIERINLNENNLERAISWVSVVDAKASFILSLILVILGYFISQSNSIFKLLNTLIKKEAFGTLGISVFFLVTAFLSLLISLGYLVVIIYPKRKTDTKHISFFYFDHIAKMEDPDFKSKMSSMGPEEIISGIADQTYNVSKVVQKKFDQLSRSIVFFATCVGSFMILFLIIKILNK